MSQCLLVPRDETISFLKKVQEQELTNIGLRFSVIFNLESLDDHGENIFLKPWHFAQRITLVFVKQQRLKVPCVLTVQAYAPAMVPGCGRSGWRWPGAALLGPGCGSTVWSLVLQVQRNSSTSELIQFLRGGNNPKKLTRHSINAAVAINITIKRQIHEHGC